MFVKDMAKLKKEPLSSMGYDRVLTVFSQHHPTLFKYLQQTFAEVTNPPIDPYREGGAMSLTTYLGRSPLDGRRAGCTATARSCPSSRWSCPPRSCRDAIIEEIRQQRGARASSCSTRRSRSRGGAEALRASLHRAPQRGREGRPRRLPRAVHLATRRRASDGIDPIPSLLALGAVHTYLCQQGLRDRCSLIVQAGDIQEGHDVCCLVAFGADAVHPYLMLRLDQGRADVQGPGHEAGGPLDARECLENLFAALEDTLKKIISKMGITTIEGYRGAMLFEAVGFGPELMEFLGDFPSRGRRDRLDGAGRGRAVAGAAGREDDACSAATATTWPSTPRCGWPCATR